MTLNQCITDGGLPDAWTRENLVWLAQAHRRHAHYKTAQAKNARADWHARWATFIEDLLETPRVKSH